MQERLVNHIVKEMHILDETDITAMLLKILLGVKSIYLSVLLFDGTIILTSAMCHLKRLRKINFDYELRKFPKGLLWLTNPID